MTIVSRTLTAKRMARRTLTAVFASTAALAFTAPASAQTAAPAGPAWQKVCGQGEADTAETCNVTQGLRAENGQFVAQVQVQERGDEKRFLIAVPEAMILPPGLQIQVDGNAAQTVPYRICTRGACYADATIDDNFVAALKRGSSLTVTTLNQAGEGVDFPFTLAGFTAAYDGEGIDAGALAAEQQRLREGLQQRAEAARQRLLQEDAPAAE